MLMYGHPNFPVTSPVGKVAATQQLMWSWTSTDYRIGITSPHFQTRQSNHLSVTQPLLADLELDGQPELV